MARMIGGPSKYLRYKRFTYVYDGVLLIVVMVWFYLTYLLLLKYFNFHPISSIALSVFIIGVFRVIDHKEWQLIDVAKKYRQGLDGEAVVAQELQKLADNYTVIQDVKMPGMKTNIDFVVLGANGIFAVEVKSHSGTITYNGKRLLLNGYKQKFDFLWQATMESKNLTEYLQANVDRSLYAKPILVFSGQKTWMKFGMMPINGVAVIKVDWIREQIIKNNAPTPIPKHFIDQIVALLSPSEPHGDLGEGGVK